MTDQCKTCTARCNLPECESLDCGHHENWYAKAKDKEIAELKAHVERLRHFLMLVTDERETLFEVARRMSRMPKDCKGFKKAEKMFGKVLDAMEGRWMLAPNCTPNDSDEETTMNEIKVLSATPSQSLSAHDAAILKKGIWGSHEAADAFWEYWKENGEPHKHGYFESTWGAINAAIQKAKEV